MAYIQVIGGLVLLVFAADFMVRGSISLAQRMGVSTLIIGLTVVAFGTSAPELVVGVDAVLTGVPTLALGNVVGSNIANIWLVVGFPAVVVPFMCNAKRFTHNMMIMLFSTAVFIGFAFTGVFTYWTGLVLLAMLAGFIYFTSRQREDRETLERVLCDMEGLPEKPDSYRVSWALIIGGLIGLVVGAHILVQGSVVIAREMGVSEAVIGLTLVALGTSIPELVTAVVAAARNHCDVAIGNVIGSNIFNLLGIIGVSSQLGDIPVPEGFLKFDLWVMALASLTLLPYAVFGRRIGRLSGLMFCGAYLAYITVVASGASGMDGINNFIGKI
ncbi:MAG: calcium/sodium antiporter [Proteobacteria bacterium]|nr:calcium/sodium antiporter [Pseudomonadota bacterium]